jgi:hypothetical protein
VTTSDPKGCRGQLVALKQQVAKTTGSEINGRENNLLAK